MLSVPPVNLPADSPAVWLVGGSGPDRPAVGREDLQLSLPNSWQCCTSSASVASKTPVCRDSVSPPG